MNSTLSNQNMTFRPHVICFKDENRNFASILKIEASRQALLQLHISSLLRPSLLKEIWGSYMHIQTES